MGQNQTKDKILPLIFITGGNLQYIHVVLSLNISYRKNMLGWTPKAVYYAGYCVTSQKNSGQYTIHRIHWIHGYKYSMLFCVATWGEWFIPRFMYFFYQSVFILSWCNLSGNRPQIWWFCWKASQILLHVGLHYTMSCIILMNKIIMTDNINVHYSVTYSIHVHFIHHTCTVHVHVRTSTHVPAYNCVWV